MRIAILLLACVAAVLALPQTPVRTEPPSQRIMGGTLTTIENYPYQAALLASWDWELDWFVHHCGGTILNQRSILTAAHCIGYENPHFVFRIRVGSTYANGGGVVHEVSQTFLHPSYDINTSDNDVAIVRLASNIIFNNNTRAGNFAGPNYNLGDNQAVWAVGWGRIFEQGPASEQLRHVQLLTVNLVACRNRYAEINAIVTDNMLCSGWLDIGGRDQCQGDSGGPLIHNGYVVGVCSWGNGCGNARYPGVNARVSKYTNWIQSNA